MCILVTSFVAECKYPTQLVDIVNLFVCCTGNLVLCNHMYLTAQEQSGTANHTECNDCLPSRKLRNRIIIAIYELKTMIIMDMISLLRPVITVKTASRSSINGS